MLINNQFRYMDSIIQKDRRSIVMFTVGSKLDY